jgi:hypothetical protein
MASEADAGIPAKTGRRVAAVEGAHEVDDLQRGSGRALKPAAGPDALWWAPSRPWRVGLLGIIAALGTMLVTGAASRLLTELGAAPPQVASPASPAPPSGEPAPVKAVREVALGSPSSSAVPTTPTWRIQVGAFRRPESAERYLVELRRTLPEVASLRVSAEHHQGLTRLRLGSFETEAAARRGCRAIMASGRSCYPVTPESSR